MKVDYHPIPHHVAGTFAASRRKHAWLRPHAARARERARLVQWEAEGGALARETSAP